MINNIYQYWFGFLLNTDAILLRRREGYCYMSEHKKKGRTKGRPIVAPGYDDEKFGENASDEEIREDNYTRVTRVFLDENDPG